VMSLGTGLGAWLGGLLLSTNADGHITGYGTTGWIAAALALGSAWWVSRVRAAETPPPQRAPTVESTVADAADAVTAGPRAQ
jgi:DHA1 family inner membrane transport protein